MKIQFQVLYREFLFRIVDLELLSADAQGDANTLLGQFAALLVFFSFWLSLTALAFMGSKMPPLAQLIGVLTMEHFLIATTMLVVGLFAVLSWDSTFPDRRDVLVLAPLPVRGRTLFLAKVTASASALGLAVAVLNAFTGLLWPFALVPESGDIAGVVRSLAAYWITMLAAGVFIYCSVLCVQGLSAQLLPRRMFLRASAFLQIAALCVFVSVYFLQPSFASLSQLVDPRYQHLLSWLPSYWFLGLLQQLNGTMLAALDPLARRAWAGLAIAVCGAAVAFLLSWFRTLRKIVEEPDIVAGLNGSMWLPRFGNSVETAVVHFSIRTLLRSRRHRLILAFYVGIGFSLMIFFVKTPEAQAQILATSGSLLGRRVNVPLLASTIVMLGFWIVGTRVVFAMPLDLRANWIFRITPIRGAAAYLRASRRALLVLGLLPLWTVSALLLLSIWPWPAAMGHLVVLGLLGTILADICLRNFQKIPFTCSYLPGKSNAHVTFWVSILLIISITGKTLEIEQRALDDPKRYFLLVGILCIAAILAKRRNTTDEPLEFEEVPSWHITTLGNISHS